MACYKFINRFIGIVKDSSNEKEKRISGIGKQAVVPTFLVI